MSRYIDTDKPLSDLDRAYLVERSEHGTIALVDALHDTDAHADTPERENTVEETEWVRSLSVEDLRKELAESGQPTDGRKDELQRRLLSALAAG